MEICRSNKVNLLELEISHLLDLTFTARTLYSTHYVNGRGFIVDNFQVGPEVIRGMGVDPQGLKPTLFNPRGAAYTILEDGFLICCSVVCKSRVGGATLFIVVT